MKEIIGIVLMLLCSGFAMAQDIIVKRDGSLIKTKVIRVGESEVEYKKFESTSDRIYSIRVDNILSITYEDGEVEKFEAQPAASSNNAQATGTPSVVDALPCSDNASLIAKYNLPIKSKIPQKDKNVESAFLFLGVKDNSVLSTDELEIKLVSTLFDFERCSHWSKTFIHHGGPYQVKVINKSNNLLFIDLGSTFRTTLSEESHTYFNTDVVSSTSGSHTGAAVGLGIIGIAGGNSESTTTVRQMERILAIPPHGSKLLSSFRIICADQLKCKVVSANEPMPGEEELKDRAVPYVFQDTRLLNSRLKSGQVIEYTQENTIGCNKYQISYSTDPNLKVIKNVKFETYLRCIIGIDDYEYSRKKVTEQWSKSMEGDMDNYIFENLDRKWDGHIGPKDAK